MTLKNDWRFQFAAKDLAEASGRLHDYHSDRAEHWDAEYEAATERAEQAGLVVDRIQVTGGTRAQVRLDPKIQDDLQRADRKRGEHQQKAEEYARWRDSFGLMLENQIYDLDPEDVAYFDLTEARVSA